MYIVLVFERWPDVHFIKRWKIRCGEFLTDGRLITSFCHDVRQYLCDCKRLIHGLLSPAILVSTAKIYNKNPLLTGRHANVRSMTIPLTSCLSILFLSYLTDSRRGESSHECAEKSFLRYKTWTSFFIIKGVLECALFSEDWVELKQDITGHVCDDLSHFLSLFSVGTVVIASLSLAKSRGLYLIQIFGNSTLY